MFTGELLTYGGDVYVCVRARARARVCLWMCVCGCVVEWVCGEG